VAADGLRPKRLVDPTTQLGYFHLKLLQRQRLGHAGPLVAGDLKPPVLHQLQTLGDKRIGLLELGGLRVIQNDGRRQPAEQRLGDDEVSLGAGVNALTTERVRRVSVPALRQQP